ncbi:MAG: flagellar hook-length control protein FliK [Lachnospiraceae bacterium]|nr:flagellar hook-length control protein FliK [Lachnospiraceae bacterium]
MASLPVNNNLNVLTNIVNQAVSMSDNQNGLLSRQAAEGADSFEAIMNRVNTPANSAEQVQSSKLSGVETGKTVSAQVAKSEYVKQESARTDTQTDKGKSVKTDDETAKQTDKTTPENKNSEENVSTENVSEEKVSESEQDAVKDAGEKLVEEVAKELDITSEEVLEAMEILGLTTVMLLDPDNMKQLLLELSGSENQLAIVTDAELYGHLQNLLGMISEGLEELQAQLGLTEEELNALIADMSVVEREPEEDGVMQELPMQSQENDTVNLEGMKDYAVTVHKDGETIEVKVTVDDVSGEKSTREEITETTKMQEQPEAKSENRNPSEEGKGETKGENHFAMPVSIEQPNVSDILQQPTVERFVNTEEILNQITEYIKLNLKADVQELELQLHPASLGTVNIHLTAKDGMITAQFAAQNEAVKAAIESQLVQLKTQFEEQGIKVDAVEVTVGDYHRYGQNFSQNQEENAPENKEGSKKGRRNINLEELDLDELPEDMDDSERIAAEMMAQSGNTVDYTA